MHIHVIRIHHADSRASLSLLTSHCSSSLHAAAKKLALVSCLIVLFWLEFELQMMKMWLIGSSSSRQRDLNGTIQIISINERVLYITMD
jgi:hypothetical protein